MHQMRLAKPDAAIQKQRVEGDCRRLGRAPGHGEGQLIRLADNEIGECVTRIEPGPQRLGAGFCPGLFRSRPLLRHARRGLRGDTDLDLPHLAEFGSRDHAKPVGILACHPFAGERRVRFKRQRSVFKTADPKRLDPVAPGCLADILAHAAGDARPRVLGVACRRRCPVHVLMVCAGLVEGGCRRAVRRVCMVSA